MEVVTWPVRKESEVALQRAEMRMVRWMCNVKVTDIVPSKELRERLGIDDIKIDTTAKQAAMVWACAAKRKETRMWANAQPDGRPAEHRWRPLFNAAKFG